MAAGRLLEWPALGARRPTQRGPTLSALLEIREISRRFGGVQALDKVSLDVPEGAVVGLIGPNGAGKTTLFNIVSGLCRADSGTITFEGTNISLLTANRRAALGISRSFQNLGLMQHETVATNVLAALHRSTPYRAADVLLRPWRHRRGEQVLRRKCDATLFAYGLVDDRDEVVSELSFAKSRFVELAAVTAEAPRLLLLDEPTTGLDVVEVATLERELARIKAGGATILVVAHDTGFVMRTCDDIYVLAEGRMLFHGDAAAVSSSGEVIDAYLGTKA